MNSAVSPRSRRDAPRFGRGVLQGADRRGAHRHHPAPFLPCSVDGGRCFRWNFVALRVQAVLPDLLDSDRLKGA